MREYTNKCNNASLLTVMPLLGSCIFNIRSNDRDVSLPNNLNTGVKYAVKMSGDTGGSTNTEKTFSKEVNTQLPITSTTPQEETTETKEVPDITVTRTMGDGDDSEQNAFLALWQEGSNEQNTIAEAIKSHFLTIARSSRESDDSHQEVKLANGKHFLPETYSDQLEKELMQKLDETPKENASVVELLDQFIQIVGQVRSKLQEGHRTVLSLQVIYSNLSEQVVALIDEMCNQGNVSHSHTAEPTAQKEEEAKLFKSKCTGIIRPSMSIDELLNFANFLKEKTKNLERMSKWKAELLPLLDEASYRLKLDGNSYSPKSSQSGEGDVLALLVINFGFCYRQFVTTIRLKSESIEGFYKQIFFETLPSVLKEFEKERDEYVEAPEFARFATKKKRHIYIPSAGAYRDWVKETAVFIASNIENADDLEFIESLAEGSGAIVNCVNELTRLNIKLLEKVEKEVNDDMDENISISLIFLRREEQIQGGYLHRFNHENVSPWSEMINSLLRHVPRINKEMFEQRSIHDEGSEDIRHTLEQLKLHIHEHCQIFYCLIDEIGNIFSVYIPQLSHKHNNEPVQRPPTTHKKERWYVDFPTQTAERLNIKFSQIPMVVDFINAAVECDFDEKELVKQYPKLEKRKLSLTAAKELFYFWRWKTRCLQTNLRNYEQDLLAFQNRLAGMIEALQPENAEESTDSNSMQQNDTTISSAEARTPAAIQRSHLVRYHEANGQLIDCLFNVRFLMESNIIAMENTEQPKKNI